MQQASSDIKIMRLVLGKTQDQLAREVGCSRPCISMIEHDRVRPGRELAEKLCAALGIPLSRFHEQGGEGE